MTGSAGHFFFYTDCQFLLWVGAIKPIPNVERPVFK